MMDSSWPPRLRVLYVQKYQKTFYYLPPCPHGEERSDEPCGHGERPTTDRVSAQNGRRRARSKSLPCTCSRTVDRASAAAYLQSTPAFARQGGPHERQNSFVVPNLSALVRRHRRLQGQ